MKNTYTEKRTVELEMVAERYPVTQLTVETLDQFVQAWIRHGRQPITMKQSFPKRNSNYGHFSVLGKLGLVYRVKIGELDNKREPTMRGLAFYRGELAIPKVMVGLVTKRTPTEMLPRHHPAYNALEVQEELVDRSMTKRASTTKKDVLRNRQRRGLFE